MKKILPLALGALALIAPHLDAVAADVFWVPLHDGQTWSFLQWGSSESSDGSSESWGPERIDAHIQAVDLQILDHHADWRMSNENDTRYTGTYLSETAGGLFEVSRGNAAIDTYYRYYIDPQPWIYLKQSLEVGQSVSFNGLRRGLFGLNNAWSGTWSET